MPAPAARRSARTADPDFMLSLARGLDVIRAFGTTAVLPVAEVARRAQISRAAARRCLRTLERLGYAAAAPGGYELAPKVLTLGSAYLGSAKLARIAQPVLERASDHLQESCSVSVLDGQEIVYVARAAVRRIISIGLFVGSRLPANCTSMGRVLWAYESPDRQHALTSAARLVAHTPRTIVSVAALRQELVRIRAAGFALVDQELELGLRSVAVPILLGDGTAIAALNVGVEASRVPSRTMTREYVPILRKAASDISAALGYGRR